MCCQTICKLKFIVFLLNFSLTFFSRFEMLQLTACMRGRVCVSVCDQRKRRKATSKTNLIQFVKIKLFIFHLPHIIARIKTNVVREKKETFHFTILSSSGCFGWKFTALNLINFLHFLLCNLYTFTL